MTTLSKRIQALVNLISFNEYEAIYDTCCDHGKIGLEIYQRSNYAQKIVFIDIASHLIDLLDKVIADIPKSFANLKTKTLSVKDLSCEKSDLIIIAGVGGDLVINSIKEHIKTNSLPKNYLLSPHTKHMETREELSRLGFRLLKEVLVFEDGIYYDHYLISKEAGSELTFVNKTSKTSVLKNYYEKHAKLLSIKDKYQDSKAREYLNIINNLMISFK